jgi:hypothetical protein
LTTTPRAPRFRSALCTLTLAGLLLTGCGDKDAEAVTDETPSSPSGSSPSSETASSDAVEPATGRSVETTWYSVHAPRGWQVRVLAKNFSIVAQDLHSSAYIAFGITDTYGYQDTLAQLAKANLRTSAWPAKPDLVEETTVAGEPAYHLVGPSGDGFDLDVFGVLHDRQHVSAEFALHGSPQKRLAIVESVLASWQWK